MVKSICFEDLIVWQKAHTFVLSVYKMTKTFQEDERFGLISQFRRAAISIPANIAEGFKRRGAKDKVHFLNIAHGSLEECKYYLILSEDLKYINENPLTKITDEIGKLLNSYSQAILTPNS